MIELRQSTERIIPVGSAMAVGDGFTPVTTLDLSTADQAEILKANGAATVDISGYTFTAITGADGWYHLTVTASGSDTLGEGKVVIQDESLVLPIEETFMVLTQNAWDSKYGTDKLQVDVVEVAGSAVAGVGDFKADVSNLDVAVSTRSTHSAADVWLATTRTLTNFGTLAADVWAVAVRTITGGTVGTVTDGAKEATKFDPAADTVAHVTLVDTTTANTDMAGTDGAALASVTATEANVDAVGSAVVGLNNITAADVWAVTPRTLTSFGSLVADVATAVWAAAVRSLTDKLGFAPTVGEIDTELTTAHGSGPWTTGAGGGTGGAVTVTILDNATNPVVGAALSLKVNVGNAITIWQGVTDGNGQAIIDGPNIGNYVLIASLVGYSIPDTAIVMTVTPQAIQVDAVIVFIIPPPGPELATVYGNIADVGLDPLTPVVVQFLPKIGGDSVSSGYQLGIEPVEVTTDAAGFFQQFVATDADLRVVCCAATVDKTFNLPQGSGAVNWIDL